jgi:NADPH-ferrihemoprotein reductase
VIAASIVENGLISKHFERNPTKIKAELRPSSFKDYSKWRKVIFIGAGTGFAPFRGFLQEQQIAKNENREVPLISVYFGCKNRNSDFIYK